MNGRIVGWGLLALLGIALAVALSVAASNLSTQPIGLSAEPLRAGDRLAPPVTPTVTVNRPAKRKSRKARARPPASAAPPTTTTTAPSTPTTSPGATTTGAVPGDDHGGRSRGGSGSSGGSGGSGGHGSDD